MTVILIPPNRHKIYGTRNAQRTADINNKIRKFTTTTGSLLYNFRSYMGKVGRNGSSKYRSSFTNFMAAGDVVLALPSSGFHSNGYSLVRKVFDVENADLGRYDDELGETLGEALLRPTVIYVKPVLRCIEAADVKGVSHITGGGFYENVPRCIPDGLCAKIDKAAVKTPAIFRLLQKKGGIDEHDMFNTFNMGVGMAVIVSPETADAALSALKAEGIDAYVCGEIVAGEEKVVLC